MRFTSALTISLAGLFFVAWNLAARADEPKPPEAAADTPAKDEQAPEKPRPKITISKETTVLEGPLTAKGYVDYVAALNQQNGKDVTAENNAVVLMWQAFGPASIPEPLREKYFKQLGIEPLPLEGEYFMDFGEFVKRKKAEAGAGQEKPAEATDEDLYAQLIRAMNAPWSNADYPLVSQWLAANEKPLRTLVDATKRPRYFSPLVGAEESPMAISVLLLGVQETREVARALGARAMLRLEAGEVEPAWQDLLACHRLGRLVGQGPTLIDALVGLAINGIAAMGDTALAHHAELTADQVRAFQADLLKLPPLPRMVDRIDVAERYMYMDVVARLAEGGPQVLEDLGAGQESSAAQILSGMLSNLLIDWDEPLRLGNEWYDRTVAAERKPTFTARAETMAKLDEELKTLLADARNPSALAKSLLLSGQSPRTVMGRQIGKVLIALLLPATQAATNAEYRETMRMDLVRMALALAAYRTDHGKYPKTLGKLSPKYLADIPKDLFDDEALHYAAEDQGKGYVLYSVGPNRADDGGCDGQSPKPADDIVIRTPKVK
jgi:hypothetical protein